MKSKKSDVLVLIISLILLVIVYNNRTSITKYIFNNLIIKKEVYNYYPNIYTKGNNFQYFIQTDNFFPENRSDLKNVLYTLLDKGNSNFSFFCDDGYTNCEQDLKSIINDGTLNHINNFIHPFNSFKSINLSINNFGKVSVTVYKNYSDYEITIINNIIDNFINTKLNDTMSLTDKIKSFHDLIINNTKYDSAEAEIVENDPKATGLNSHKAYNVLINGLGLCGGYTDTLAIFLNKIGVDNIKVANDKHIWNVIFINDEWLHIDATWDDPIASNGKDILIHDYFLITNTKLQTLDPYKHLFNNTIYIEAQ